MVCGWGVVASGPSVCVGLDPESMAHPPAIELTSAVAAFSAVGAAEPFVSADPFARGAVASVVMADMLRGRVGQSVVNHN